MYVQESSGAKRREKFQCEHSIKQSYGAVKVIPPLTKNVASDKSECVGGGYDDA
jgi:hypothetical protein